MTLMKPSTRLALSITALTLSIILISEMLGFFPNHNEAKLETRKNLTETLAITVATNASNEDISALKQILNRVRERNLDIQSIGIRRSDGISVIEVGNHYRHWDENKKRKSSSSHTQVTIYNGSQEWGKLEVVFAPVTPKTILGLMNSPFMRLIAFICISGFLGYMFILKRSLRELDPTSVVPERVRSALDTMAESVLVLDGDAIIVLVNNAFTEKTGWSSQKLLGKNVNTLNWQLESKGSGTTLPWQRALKEGTPQMGIRMSLLSEADKKSHFMVNSVAIMGGNNRPRGVLVTLDDVTQLQQKNEDLQNMLVMLQESQAEVSKKNIELETLAREDPLTGLLNRRSLFSRFEKVYKKSKEKKLLLSCLMVDIDHFKRINDKYGHSVGDQVIRRVSKILKDSLRSVDIIGRYGGEEFCIVLIGADASRAAGKAELMRNKVAAQTFNIGESSTSFSISASFGIADMSPEISGLNEFIDQADKALLQAKESGRNCVICWNEIVEREYNRLYSGNATNDNYVIEKTSSHTLSSLNDRRQFMKLTDKVIKSHQRQSDQIAIILLNINKFKRINHSLGHAAGDELLSEISLRLKACLKANDSQLDISNPAPQASLARVGADEFGVLLINFEDTDYIDTISSRIREVLYKPYNLQGHHVYLTVTMGVSIHSADCYDAECLMKNADIAIQHASQSSTHGFQVYNNELSHINVKHLELEDGLHKALKEDQFQLYYQPKVESSSRRIMGVETLLRWKHPEKGLIQPSEFLPVAEYSGLIVPIGEWVLKTACRHARSWLDQGITDLRIAVNLSPQQFQEDNLLDVVSDTLKENKLPGTSLELEITESSIMRNLEEAILTMQRLRRLGVQMTVDDFGTGYSSLYYLKRFPIDNLKIDQSFIKDMSIDPDNAALVNAIISMAHSLRLRVIAEGVENMTQVDQLVNMQCDEMQGYLLGRPKPYAEISKILSAPNVVNLAKVTMPRKS